MNEFDNLLDLKRNKMIFFADILISIIFSRHLTKPESGSSFEATDAIKRYKFLVHINNPLL